jgi:hypothetical protein
MKLYHFALTKEEVHQICNALNIEATEFDNRSHNKKLCEGTRLVLIEAAASTRSLVRRLLDAEPKGSMLIFD